MTSPFVNDPFAIVWQAFKNLYPDKDCICQFAVLDADKSGKAPYGVTDFQPDGRVFVFVDGNMKIADAVEVFAHELAHVAVGIDADHGEEWEAAFDAIFNEYNRIAQQIIDTGENDDETN